MYTFFLQIINNTQQGWGAINWNIMLPTILSSIGVMFASWMLYQNNRIKAIAEEVHKAVNSTAKTLADEKTRQEDLIKDLVAQVSLLTEQARGKTMAGLVERVHVAEAEKEKEK